MLLNEFLGGTEDYISGPYPVIFLAGMTRVAIGILINDDNVFENNENFSLAIDPSYSPSYVTVGHPDKVTVTILDDDCKMVAISN